MANNIAVKITADVADLVAKRAVMSAELKAATKDLNDLARNARAGGMTDELRAGMLKAAEATAQARAEMRGLDAEMKKIAADGARAQLSPFARLTGDITSARGAVVGLGEAVIAAFAVERVVEFSKQMGEAAEQTVHMAMAFGLTGAEAQRFNAELLGLGIAPEAGQRAFVRLDNALTRAREGMKAQGAAFQKIGVDIAKPVGNLQLFNETIAGLSKIQDVPTRVGLAMQLMGRGIQDIAPLLGVTKEQFEAVNKAIDASGAVDEEALQKGLALAEAQNEQKVAAQGLGNTLVSALGPALTVATRGFTSLIQGFVASYKAGGAAKDVMVALGGVLKVLISIVEGLVVGIEYVVAILNGFAYAAATVAVVLQDTLGGAIRSVIGLAGALGTVLQDVFSGNFAKAAADAGEAMRGFGRNVGLTLDNIARDAKEGGRKTGQNFADGLNAIVGGSHNLRQLWGLEKTPELPALPKGGGGASDMQDKLPKGGKGPGAVARWTEQLHAQEIASGEFFKDQTQAELAFWQSKLALTTQGSREWLEVQSKIYDAQKKLAHEAYDQHLAELNDTLEADRNNWTQEQADWAAKLAFIASNYGEQSREYHDAHRQFEAAERQHQQLMLQIQRDGEKEALAELKSTLAANKTIRDQNARTAEARINQGATNSPNPLAGVKAEQALMALRQQLNRQQLADEEATYAQEDALRRQAIADAVAADGLGSRSYKAATDAKALADREFYDKHRALENQMVNQAQQDQLKIAAAWHGKVDPVVGATGSALKGLINGTETWRQALLKIGESIEDVILTAIERMVENWIVGQITGQAQSAVTGAAQALSNAAVAGSAAYASTAMIPIVGPELAPAAAAAAYAGAASYAALASLDAGTNLVPNDMIAQIHAGERIIPAAENAALMAAVSGNNPGGGSGDNHFHSHYSPTVYGQKTQSLEDLMAEQASGFLRGLRGMARDGHLEKVMRAAGRAG